MLISFGDAKRELKRYAGNAGKCVDDPGVDLFVKSVIQELLQSGASGNIRKWVFVTQNGRFTAPADLELPLSVRIEDGIRNRAAVVYDKWYEFYDQSTLADCHPWEEGLVEEPNTFFTVFDPPHAGTRVLAIAQCQEALDAHFMLDGVDRQDRAIFMPDDGEIRKGERLTIRKFKPKYTLGKYAGFTGIVKTPTKGYVRLYWFDPKTGHKGLLSEYAPNTTNPSFRRFRVIKMGREDTNRCYKVTLLGRVRLLDNYAERDIIPVTNLRAMKLIAQQIQAEDNDNIQVSDYKGKRALQVIENENQYKRTPQASVNFASETSPGRIINII